jgi:hypothetical protein
VRVNPIRWASLWLALSMLAALVCLPEPAFTQEEVASAIHCSQGADTNQIGRFSLGHPVLPEEAV